MASQNRLVIDRLAQLGTRGACLKQLMADTLIKHKPFIDEHGEDMPEVRGWKWGEQSGGSPLLKLLKPAA